MSRIGELRDEILAVWRSIPGGNPRTRDELLAVVVLAALARSGWSGGEEGCEAARSRMVRLGCGLRFTGRPGETLGLCLLAAERWVPACTASVILGIERLGHGPMDLVRSTVQLRVNAAWSDVEQDRAAWAGRGEEALQEILPRIPDGLSLLPHQAEAIARIRVSGWRYLLFDDMGLGKSVTTLATLLLHGDPWPALVVCPKSMVGRWKWEGDRWLARAGGVRIAVRTPADVPAVLPPRALLSASWGLLSTRPDVLTRHRWGAVVADEAHALCNPESERTRAFGRLRSGARVRLLLTGTPDPNGRAMEFWPLVRAVDERSLGLREWGDRFGDPKVLRLGKRRIVRYDGRSDHAGLAEILAPISLRRVKAELPEGTLPDKTRKILPVPLGEEGLRVLLAEKDAVRAKLQTRALALEHALREEGVEEGLVVARVRSVLGAEVVSALSALRIRAGELKVGACVELVTDLCAAGERPIVWCAHRRVAALAVEALGKVVGEVRSGLGVDSTGGRDRLVADWENGQGRVLVLTRKMHTGVTLVSGASAIFLERWWLPAEERQAEDRCARIGQTRACRYWYLHLHGSPDDAMARVLTWKERGSEAMQGSASVRVLEWLGLSKEVESITESEGPDPVVDTMEEDV